MKLLLTSGGFLNDSISKALLDLTQKPFDELKLAFIPTAANVEDGNKDWLIDDLYNCKKLSFKEIDIIDISALPKELFLPRLEDADILMFGGGNSFHLMHWIVKTGLNILLPDLLKNRVYVGISAGSMIATPSLILAQSKQLYYPEGVGNENDMKTLGFVPFHFRPHLNAPWCSKVRVEYLEELAKEIPEEIYALDDESAIKIVDNEITVISEGTWKKFN